MVQRKPAQKTVPASRKRSSVVKALDREFSLWIRARDRRCVQCGREDQLTCGHVFSRVAYSTRWDPRNAFGQCMGHNLRHEHDPWPFLNYARTQLGAEQFDAMHLDYSTPRKWTTADLEDLLHAIRDRRDGYDLPEEPDDQ